MFKPNGHAGTAETGGKLKALISPVGISSWVDPSPAAGVTGTPACDGAFGAKILLTVQL